jgi:two-component system, OmpR family, response regulator RegX3
MPRPRILLVEDEEAIAEPLAEALKDEGFLPERAATAAAALESFRASAPDLVLLDVMLPDSDGREVLRQIRATSPTPVIMLTARGAEVDRVLGLELGADDYVTKPFSASELSARIRAVLRRVEAPAPPHASEILVGDVSMNLDTRTVTQGEARLELTLKEFELLRMLMESAGRVVSRGDLIDEVWDPHWFGPTKTLDVHVSSLRKKLGDESASPRYVHTVRGVGFRFASPEELTG